MKERIARLSNLLKTTPRKKLLALAGLILIAIALPLTVIVSQQQTNTQQHAAGITTYTPSSYYPAVTGTGVAKSYLNRSTSACTTGNYLTYYSSSAVTTGASDVGKTVSIAPCNYVYYSSTSCTTIIGYDNCQRVVVTSTTPAPTASINPTPSGAPTPAPTVQPTLKPTPTPAPGGSSCTYNSNPDKNPETCVNNKTAVVNCQANGTFPSAVSSSNGTNCPTGSSCTSSPTASNPLNFSCVYSCATAQAVANKEYCVTPAQYDSTTMTPFTSLTCDPGRFCIQSTVCRSDCTPGAAPKCTDNLEGTMVCKQSACGAYVWTLQDNCTQGCIVSNGSAACNTSTTTICTNGEADCIGQTPRLCQSGNWVNQTTCVSPQSCNNRTGKCETPATPPPTTAPTPVGTVCPTISPKSFPPYTGGTPDNGNPNGMTLSQWLSGPASDTYELSAQFLYLLRNINDTSITSQAGDWFQQRMQQNEIGVNVVMHVGEILTGGTPDNVRGEYYPGYTPSDMQLVQQTMNDPKYLITTGLNGQGGSNFTGAFSANIVTAINKFASTGWSPIIGATQVINGTLTYIRQDAPYSPTPQYATTTGTASCQTPVNPPPPTCTNGSCPGDTSGNPNPSPTATPFVCTDGRFNCAANNVQICVNNSWGPYVPCATTQACNATTGTCDTIPTPTPTARPTPTPAPSGFPTPRPTPTLAPTPTPTPSGCTNGTYQCAGQVLQICQNHAWAPSQTCSANQTCSVNPPSCLNNGGGTGNTTLGLDLGLDGIGSAGDHQNQTGGGNTNPKTPTRSVLVQIYDTNNNLVDTENGTIAYQTGGAFPGTFHGNVALKNGFTTGSYRVYVKSPRYLRKEVGGIRTITAGISNPSTLAYLTAGDIVDDNAITILDYNVFLSCSIFSKDGGGACNQNSSYRTNADLNDNGVIDQDDYNLLLREWVVQNGE